LSKNSISCQGLRNIHLFLSKNNYLYELYLNWNHIAGEGALKIAQGKIIHKLICFKPNKIIYFSFNYFNLLTGKKKLLHNKSKYLIKKFFRPFIKINKLEFINNFPRIQKHYITYFTIKKTN
jgi:hypothetical protein